MLLRHFTCLVSSALLLAACNPPAEVPQDDASPQVAVTGEALSGQLAEDAREIGTFATLTGELPAVIAHRGASGFRPEHTRSAYLLALEQGADILEPDLMVSRDGVLIVRHDPWLSTSTDIADRPEFADRRRELMGREDWWVVDFTAEELTSLGARQVYPGRSDEYDDSDTVLTFGQFLDLVDEAEAACACEIPVEPEIKLPAEHTAMGLDPAPILIAELEARGLNTDTALVIIQSFDAPFLERLRPMTPLPLAMLHYNDEPGGDMNGYTLEQVAGFVDAIGAYKGLLLNPDGSSTGYLERAHALGLAVHTWTHRDDAPSILAEGDTDAELRALFALGVDGVFTDFPASAVRVREAMLTGE
ncbi:MAG: glycerophosphodiester phosphodiesterase family protein [Caulobacterales bacterium]|uniref:glycerophosphodiester phosphodiesterase family protein n=1 Tax=Glycocaulis sp. TaxID=1969725 RepID=UPI003FA083A3